MLHYSRVVGTITAIKLFGAFKHHVLKNMCRASRASDFVACTDIIGHHYGGDGQAFVRHQEDAQPIISQPIFFNAVECLDVLNPIGQC